MRTIWADYITTSGFSGFRRVDSDGKPFGMGLATKQCVLHFYPDALFLSDEELEQLKNDNGQFGVGA